MEKLKFKEEILRKKGFIFDFYQIKLLDLATKKEIYFDLIKHKGAVAVLLTYEDNFVLVNQYRYVTNSYQDEIVAGKIESSDKSLTSSVTRECLEELGVKIKDLKYIEKIMPSGGVCNETIYLFTAQVAEFTNQVNFDEFEDVKMKIIKQSEALKLVRNGEISDGKTALMIMRYCNERNKNSI